MRLSDAIGIAKQSLAEWSEDGAPRLAAALSYYTVFSLAPLMFIAIAVAGLVFADADARVTAQLAQIMGDDAAQFFRESAMESGPSGGIIATVIGIVVLLFGAAGLFGQLQDALNTIWEVRAKPGQGWLAFIKQRFFSFALVGGTAFLLLVSLMASTAISAAIDYFGARLPGLGLFWQAVNFVIAAGFATLVFALIFKIVPDVVIRWRDVWVGAAFTGILFTVGQLLLGLYLGWQATDSPYGAAGALIVVLLWVYYAAQILFLGAEFTQVTAKRRGVGIVPARNAERIDEATRAAQGLVRDGGPARATGVPPSAANIAFLLGERIGRSVRSRTPQR